MDRDKKKNICLILPGKLPVPNMKGGGIETLMTLLIDENELYNKVHFIIVCAWADGIEAIADKYHNTEFHYVKIRTGFTKKVISFVNYVIARTTGNIDFFKSPLHYDIEDVMKNIHADVVVVEHGMYKHFEFLKKKYCRNQLYLHLHGTGPLPDRRTRETFGHVIAVSNFVKNLYEPGFSKNNTNFHVCLNGIDNSRFKKRITYNERQQIRNKYGVSEKDLLVIYCGRLVHEKGVKEIINGIIGIDNEHIKLMIVGSSFFQSSKKTRYMKEIYDAVQGFEDRVFFTGYLPNDELLCMHYQASDIQVICSLYEDAAPVVALEGQLCGLPLIITDSGGIREYMKCPPFSVIQKNDALNNANDRKKISECLAHVLTQYYEKWKESRNKWEFTSKDIDEFNGEEFYKRFISLFSQEEEY